MQTYAQIEERVPFEQSLATVDNGEKLVAELTSEKVMYCSMHAETMEQKAKLFKAMNNPEKLSLIHI